MTDEACPQYFGKFRGVIENPFDLQGLGRVQVSVPDVLGAGTMAWAMPCFPGAGPAMGFFAIPPRGAKCWVEFERGDPDYPIWSGGYWVLGDTPVPPGPMQILTRAWVGENFKLEVLDIPGAATLTLTLTTATGEAVITAGPEGLELKAGAGSIKLALDGVSINGSNLKVLP